MKITVIHLSDIHLKHTNNSVETAKTGLFNAILKYTINVEAVFVLISGDIANTGHPDEYTLAERLLKEITHFIETNKGKSPIFITIPGNHDCDFSNANKARENQINLIRESGKDVIDTSVLELCVKPQTNYNSFKQNLNSQIYKTYESPIFSLYEFPIYKKPFNLHVIIPPTCQFSKRTLNSVECISHII